MSLGKRKTPVIGIQDFSNLDDTRVRDFKFMLCELMGNYKGCPEYETLSKVFEDLSAEYLDRLCKAPEVSSPESPEVKKPLLVKKRLGKSPLKRI